MLLEIFKIISIVLSLLLGLFILKFFIKNISSIIKEDKITLHKATPYSKGPWYPQFKFSTGPIAYTTIMILYLLAAILCITIGVVGITRLF